MVSDGINQVTQETRELPSFEPSEQAIDLNEEEDATNQLN